MRLALCGNRAFFAVLQSVPLFVGRFSLACLVSVRFAVRQGISVRFFRALHGVRCIRLSLPVRTWWRSWFSRWWWWLLFSWFFPPKISAYAVFSIWEYYTPYYYNTISAYILQYQKRKKQRKIHIYHRFIIVWGEFKTVYSPKFRRVFHRWFIFTLT